MRTVRDRRGWRMSNSNGVAKRNGKARPEKQSLDDLESARMVVEVERTGVAAESGIASRLAPEWGELALLADEDGSAGTEDGLATLQKGRLDPDRFAAIRAALDTARAEPSGQALILPLPEQPGRPKPFDLGLIDTRTFFAESYRLEWLARGILVKGQPCVFGGPQKSLKTSILIDLAVSLGSASPFLGRFDVPEAVPVALISGESGRTVIQANAKQVRENRGISPDSADQVLWGFTIPQLCNNDHVDSIRRDIERFGLKACIFDPLYLALLAGNTEINPSDMFQMGPLLAGIAEACLDVGCTPILAHHFTKRRDDPFGPPDMSELAYAGIGQFMRQWMLTSRRERYVSESGIHRLHFAFGGSAGHSGELHLDIDTGQISEDFTGRKWAVTVASPTESRCASEEQKKADREAKEAEKLQAIEEQAERSLLANVGKAVEAIRTLTARDELATQSAIAAQLNMDPAKAKAALARAITDGRIARYQAEVPAGRMGPRQVEAHRMIAEPQKGGGKSK